MNSRAGPEFRKFLLTKLLNAEVATLQVSSVSRQAIVHVYCAFRHSTPLIVQTENFARVAKRTRESLIRSAVSYFRNAPVPAQGSLSLLFVLRGFFFFVVALIIYIAESPVMRESSLLSVNTSGMNDSAFAVSFASPLIASLLCRLLFPLFAYCSLLIF